MSKSYAAKFPDGRKEKYNNWIECESKVKGIKGVLYKSFESENARDAWLESETSVHIDDESGLRVYVDGSYSKQKRKASWAFVVVVNDNIIHEESGVVPHVPKSNNIDGECYAAMNAIRWLNEREIPAKIVHDYIGISAWLTGEFKADSDIAREYVSACKNKINNIQFVKVKGHTGNRFNEYVDNLARLANG